MKILLPVLLTILTGTTGTGQQIEMTEITNPILPFSLGKARVTMQKHTFIKYIDLKQFDNPVYNIQSNTKAIARIMPTKDELYPQLQSIYEHLVYLVDQINFKLTNLKPQKFTRTKRGLINIVGRVNKWMFGTLDDEDEEKYNKAISVLSNNQNILQHDLQNYLTVTKTFMNETVNTLSKIAKNQELMFMQIKEIVNSLNRYTLFLKVQNSLDTMIIDCQNLISVLNSIEESILFAELSITHTLILPLAELKDMINVMFHLYKESLPHFDNVQSYYTLIKTEVHYNSDKILFAIHFPILQESLYDYYHLFPIPLSNQAIIPYKPYIILNSTYHHYENEPCTQIEDSCIYHVESQNFKDDCLPKLLSGNTNHKCETLSICLEQDVLEIINDAYIIAIPIKNTTIEKRCREQGFEEINKPQLIHIPYKCSVKINGNIYSNDVAVPQETPLELPKIKLVNNNPEEHPLKVPGPVNLDSLVGIQKLAERTQLHRLRALEEDDTPHITYYITIFLIIFAILLLLGILLYKNKNVLIKHFWNKNQKVDNDNSENNTDVIFSS